MKIGRQKGREGERKERLRSNRAGMSLPLWSWVGHCLLSWYLLFSLVSGYCEELGILHYRIICARKTEVIISIDIPKERISTSSVQSLSPVQLFATPWIAACQASLSITISQSSPRLTSIESVMPSSHLILGCPLFLLPRIPPIIRVFFQCSNSSHEVAKVLEFQL